MPGHIKLGRPGELRDYALMNINQYARTPANQFAAKLATGAGSYDDLQNWSYLVMEDWRAGVGKKDAEAGGFLYAEAETRYPNRLTMPPALHLANQESDSYPRNYGYQAGYNKYPTDVIALGILAEALAHQVDGQDSFEIYVSLWLFHSGQSLTVAIYTDDGTTPGKPGVELVSTTLTTESRPGAGLYAVKLQQPGLMLDGTKRHLVIRPTVDREVIYIPVNDSPVSSTEAFSLKTFGQWVNFTASTFLHGVQIYPANYGQLTKCIIFDGQPWILVNDLATVITRYDETEQWAPANAGVVNVVDMCAVGDQIWLARGSDVLNNMVYMNPDGTYSDSGVQAELLLLARGYVWRSLGGDVYYTSDGSSWAGPVTVTWNGSKVRAMAAIGDMIYCATDEGLSAITTGDYVNQVMTWPTIEPTNGVGMISHQGTLFIPVQQSLYRYDGTQMLPVGLDLGEGLPQNRLGKITHLVSMNNWLIALCDTLESSNRATIWAYNDQGWHFLAALPPGQGAVSGGGYNIRDRMLYVGTTAGHLWRLPIADSANFNNLTSFPVAKLPFAWMETDWFAGGLIEVFKDWESVYITGDNIDDIRYVDVYWQDDTYNTWQLLGRVTTPRAELRWADYTTRPNSREIKLALALYTQSDGAPVVRAVRVKYHPMVMDWYRWTFPLLVSDAVELPGNDVSSYTRAEMESHLDEMIRSVAPIIYEDVDGQQYEVKVTGCPIQIMDYEYMQDGPHYKAIYNMAIEQIRPGAYGTEA